MTGKDATDSRLTLATISNSTNHTELSFQRHSKWCPHSRKEKLLCSLCVFFLLVIIALLTGLIVVWNRFSTEKQHKKCETSSCVEAAAVMLHNMDSKINPCNDFYEYACGGFLRTINIPEDQSSVNTFNSIAQEIQTTLRYTIQQPVKRDEPFFSQIVKRLYASCNNVSIIEYLQERPLRELLNSVGGWPVIDGSEWNETAFDWQKTIALFRKHGVYMNFLMDLSVVKDLKNSSRYILQLDQPYFGLPDRGYFLKGMTDHVVQAYYQFMVDTAILLGANETIAKDEMLKALLFETELAKHALPLEDLRNFTKLYNKMTIAELQVKIPELNWTAYMNGLNFPQPIKDTEDIILIVPDYVQNVTKLLMTLNKKTVANYLMWRMVKSMMDLLDKRFQMLQHRFNSVLTGQVTEVLRPYLCTDVVFDQMDVAIGGIYIRTHFRTESKHVATELVKEVRNAFSENLNKIAWLDAATLQKAKEKATAMVDEIAYPDELLDDENINNFYRGVKITDDNYFGNILAMNIFTTDFYLSRLNRPVSEFRWLNSATAAVVNAYYKFSDNSMQFFAAILNGAFFDPERPKYLNFGSMGFIVGHEITHGFDDMGRQYDEHGNLENWWSTETDKQFQKKSQCIVDLYGNYTVPELGKKVNGIITLGENIADVGGVKQAYKAYLNWEQKHGTELPLPGLNLTSRQLFWLSNANVWCSKERFEYLELEVYTNPHSPSRFRVNGPLSNTIEFAEDFSCARGTPMNPVNKCLVW